MCGPILGEQWSFMVFVRHSFGQLVTSQDWLAGDDNLANSFKGALKTGTSPLIAMTKTYSYLPHKTQSI